MGSKQTAGNNRDAADSLGKPVSVMPENRSIASRKLVMVLLFVLLAAAIGYGAYAYTTERTLRAEIKQSNSKLSVASSEIKTLKLKLDESEKAVTGARQSADDRALAVQATTERANAGSSKDEAVLSAKIERQDDDQRLAYKLKTAVRSVLEKLKSDLEDDDSSSSLSLPKLLAPSSSRDD